MAHTVKCRRTPLILAYQVRIFGSCAIVMCVNLLRVASPTVLRYHGRVSVLHHHQLIDCLGIAGDARYSRVRIRTLVSTVPP